MINSFWVREWREFVFENGGLPGDINNTYLANFITEERRKRHFPEDDDDLELEEGKDFFQFGEELWKYFYNQYNCTVPI